MKYIFLISIFFSFTALGQNSIYDLDFETAYGAPISMKTFQGQKILIASISIENLKKKGGFDFWDSLKTAHPNIAVILIPAGDMGPITDSTAIDTLKKDNTINNASGKLLMTDKADVKKDKGKNQHPIMQWVTDVNKNKHFDADVEYDQQIYVISESGVLYAVLYKSVRQKILDEVLRQSDMKPSVLGELKQ